MPVSKEERHLIKANAKLNKYKSTAAFLRERGLETDISNKAVVAILQAWLSFKFNNNEVNVGDKTLDWARARKKLRSGVRADMYGMDKEQREQYLEKFDKILESQSQIQTELKDLLKRFYVEE